MICPNCKNDVPQNMFCHKCGSPLPELAEAQKCFDRYLDPISEWLLSTPLIIFLWGGLIFSVIFKDQDVLFGCTIIALMIISELIIFLIICYKIKKFPKKFLREAEILRQVKEAKEKGGQK
jgi:hypothetical protein